MRTIIRNNVFETNSSSSHTLSVEKNYLQPVLESFSGYINEEGDVWIDCQGYDLDSIIKDEETTIYREAITKISFLATLWNSYAEDVKDKYTIDDLIYFVKRNTLCNNVYFHNMGNICLDVSSNYKYDFLPSDKDDLYELIFSVDKEIIINYEYC